MSQYNIWIIKHCRNSLLFYNNKPWKKKEQGSFFDVTMGSCDGLELFEFIGICIQYLLEGTLQKDLMGLYRDSGLIIIRNTNKRTKYEKRS